MKQAIHIFKKDVNHLRYDIAITLLAAAIFCFLGMQQQTPASGNRMASFLPVTWWFIIARVIHAEAIPGQRQFWLTRPYEWKSLLAAKALFILVFVNLPLLLADALIIHSVGFSISHKIAGLLWTQLLLLAAFVLPAAAFSAITSGLLQQLSALFLAFIGVMALLIVSSRSHAGSYWMQLEWVKTYCLVAQVALASAGILLWQYARRNTFGARVVAAVTAVLLLGTSSLLPWTAAFALQTRMSKRQISPASIHIALDWDRKWLGQIYDSEQNQVVAELPLQISGVPNGMEIEPDGLDFTLRAPGRETWVDRQPAPASFNFEAGITSLRAEMSQDFYNKIKDEPLQLRGTFFFTLYGNKQATRIPLNRGPVPASGVGVCSLEEHLLFCNAVFRTQSALATIRILQHSVTGPKVTTEHPFSLNSYSPFPANLRIDPVYRFLSPQPNAILSTDVEAWEPLAHLKRDFKIDRVCLNDFGRKLR